MELKDGKKKATIKQKLKENLDVLREIYALIIMNKKWWLIPMFLVFAFLSIFMVLAGGSSILPAIYALF